jgi:hypothetical protein
VYKADSPIRVSRNAETQAVLLYTTGYSARIRAHVQRNLVNASMRHTIDPRSDLRHGSSLKVEAADPETNRVLLQRYASLFGPCQSMALNSLKAAFWVLFPMKGPATLLRCAYIYHKVKGRLLISHIDALLVKISWLLYLSSKHRCRDHVETPEIVLQYRPKHPRGRHFLNIQPLDLHKVQDCGSAAQEKSTPSSSSSAMPRYCSTVFDSRRLDFCLHTSVGVSVNNSAEVSEASNLHR